MFEYDEIAMKAAEILDGYDLSPFLTNCEGVDLYKFQDNPPTTNEEIECAIKTFTINELVKYLQTRYGMYVDEVPHYYVWWNDRFSV